MQKFMIKKYIFIAVLMMVGFSYLQKKRLESNRSGIIGSVTLDNKKLIKGEFSLATADGKWVNEKTFKGKYLLVFFGFTNCESVCPLGLQTMAGALASLGKDADKIVPLFISVDPDRDSLERIKTFVTQFSPKIIGLRGAEKTIRKVSQNYRSFYKKLDPSDTGAYQMAHSAIFYLMGKDSEFITTYDSDLDPEVIASKIKNIIK